MPEPTREELIASHVSQVCDDGDGHAECMLPGCVCPCHRKTHLEDAIFDRLAQTAAPTQPRTSRGDDV